MRFACKFSFFVAAGLFGMAGKACGEVIVQTNTIGYTGTWTQYTSLSNAQNGTNAVGNGMIAQRDATLDVFRGISAGPNAGPDLAQLITRWNDPANNSNNTNLNFLQYINNTNPNTNINGTWLNLERTSYGLNVTGGAATNGTDPNDPNFVGQRLGVSNGTNYGDFLSFNLSATFSGVTPGGFNTNEGFQGSGFTGVNGTATGIFQQGNNFFTFNLNLNGNVTVPPGTAAVAVFASTQVIPEPATLVAVAAFGIGGLVIRRRRNSQLA